MMRTRAHRAKMLKRGRRRWPLYWTVPSHLLDDSDAMRKALRNLVNSYWYGMPRGSVVVVEVVADHSADPLRREVVLRITPEAADSRRRDTSSVDVARWLSDPAERTP